MSEPLQDRRRPKSRALTWIGCSAGILRFYFISAPWVMAANDECLPRDLPWRRWCMMPWDFVSHCTFLRMPMVATPPLHR